MSAENSVVAEPQNRTPDTWLSRLPNEILFQIIKHLPSDSLMYLETVDERFKELVCDKEYISKVDFSQCSYLTSLVDFKRFFRPLKAALITELNFNQCSWIGNTHLVGCITKCKKLRTLSARNCNFTFANVMTVLSKIENLLSLDCTVSMQNSNKSSLECKSPLSSVHKLQTLRLDFINSAPSIVSCWTHLLPHCIFLKELLFHVILTEPGPPFQESSNEAPILPQYTQLSEILESLMVTFYIKNQTRGSMTPVYTLLYKLSRLFFSCSRNSEWKSIWIEDTLCYPSLMDEMFSSCLVNMEKMKAISCFKVKGSRPYMRVLANVIPNSLHTLSFVNVSLSDECLRNLCLSFGDNLKKLQMMNCIFIGPIQISRLLSPFFLNCANISEVNLLGTHTYLGDSPCSALQVLKGLKKVVLMSCHVKRFQIQRSEPDTFHVLRKRKRVAASQAHDYVHVFRDMVVGCTEVQECAIIKCGIATDSDHVACDEEDIAPIFKWERLKILSLHRLENFSSMKFLRYIAVQCRHFASLNIDNAGNDMCIPNLRSLFSSSESLSTVSYLVAPDPGHNECRDEDISPIFKWQMLKVLSLRHFDNLTASNILSSISTKLRHLESLNIHKFHNDSLTPTLNYLVRFSHSLTTLRITHGNVHLTRVFWTYLGYAKNLKNICLINTCSDIVPIDAVVDSLSKLTQLERFHFISTMGKTNQLSGACKKLFSKKKDGTEARKMDLIVSKITNPNLECHHTCVLDYDVFSLDIRSPMQF